tara:strand:- start:49906 stop:50196 length:291 start_codon:yes stop_codon:yes gene_type:complete
MPIKPLFQRFLPISALVFLIGCTPMADPTPSPTSRSCQAAQYQSLLWKPQSVLNNVTLPNGTRVISPDQAVTMDLRMDRMNISIGKLDRVERVFCG